MSSNVGPSSSIEPFMLTPIVFEDKDYKAKAIDSSSSPEEVSEAIQNLHDELIYPQLDEPILEKICGEIVAKNASKIQDEVDKDVYEAGILVFNKYKDLMTSQTMASFKSKYPSLNISMELNQRLEKTIRVRISQFASLVLEKPIKTVLANQFKDKVPSNFEPNFHSYDPKYSN